MGSAQYFSVFDLASGFHQTKMSSEDFHKTAFSISYGHYEFDRMPFPIEKLDVKNDVKNDAKNNVKNDVKNYPNS